MAKIITVGTGTPTQRDYINGFEYLTNGETILNRLEHFAMDEGRMRPTTPGGTTYRYEFDLKDHLGNTRMTLTDANNNGVFDNYAAEVLQADYAKHPAQTDYPFGMRITRKLSASDNKYTYNGKVEAKPKSGVRRKHENEFGLKCLPRLVDWRWHRGYHYGARYYDPAIGRWWAVDPEIEYYSPFCYLGNNVLLFVDPDGRGSLSVRRLHMWGGSRDFISSHAQLFLTNTKEYAFNKDGISVKDRKMNDLSESERLTSIGVNTLDGLNRRGEGTAIFFMDIKSSEYVDIIYLDDALLVKSVDAVIQRHQGIEQPYDLKAGIVGESGVNCQTFVQEVLAEYDKNAGTKKLDEYNRTFPTLNGAVKKVKISFMSQIGAFFQQALTFFGVPRVN